LLLYKGQSLFKFCPFSLTFYNSMSSPQSLYDKAVANTKKQQEEQRKKFQQQQEQFRKTVEERQRATGMGEYGAGGSKDVRAAAIATAEAKETARKTIIDERSKASGGLSVGGRRPDKSRITSVTGVRPIEPTAEEIAARVDVKQINRRTKDLIQRQQEHGTYTGVESSRELRREGKLPRTPTTSAVKIVKHSGDQYKSRYTKEERQAQTEEDFALFRQAKAEAEQQGLTFSQATIRRTEKPVEGGVEISTKIGGFKGVALTAKEQKRQQREAQTQAEFELFNQAKAEAEAKGEVITSTKFTTQNGVTKLKYKTEIAGAAKATTPAPPQPKVQTEAEYLASQKAAGLKFTGKKSVNLETGETSFEFIDLNEQRKANKEYVDTTRAIKKDASELGFVAVPKSKDEHGYVTEFEFKEKPGATQYIVLDYPTKNYKAGEKIPISKTDEKGNVTQLNPFYSTLEAPTSKTPGHEFLKGFADVQQAAIGAPLEGKEAPYTISEELGKLLPTAEEAKLGRRIYKSETYKARTKEAKERLGEAYAANPERFVGQIGGEIVLGYATGEGAGEVVGLGTRAIPKVAKIVGKLRVSRELPGVTRTADTVKIEPKFNQTGKVTKTFKSERVELGSGTTKVQKAPSEFKNITINLERGSIKSIKSPTKIKPELSEKFNVESFVGKPPGGEIRPTLESDVLVKRPSKGGGGGGGEKPKPPSGGSKRAPKKITTIEDINKRLEIGQPKPTGKEVEVGRGQVAVLKEERALKGEEKLIHEGVKPYHKTPKSIRKIEMGVHKNRRLILKVRKTEEVLIKPRKKVKELQDRLDNVEQRLAVVQERLANETDPLKIEDLQAQLKDLSQRRARIIQQRDELLTRIQNTIERRKLRRSDFLSAKQEVFKEKIVQEGKGKSLQELKITRLSAAGAGQLVSLGFGGETGYGRVQAFKQKQQQKQRERQTTEQQRQLEQATKQETGQTTRTGQKQKELFKFKQAQVTGQIELFSTKQLTKQGTLTRQGQRTGQRTTTGGTTTTTTVPKVPKTTLKAPPLIFGGGGSSGIKFGEGKGGATNLKKLGVINPFIGKGAFNIKGEEGAKGSSAAQLSGYTRPVKSLFGKAGKRKKKKGGLLGLGI
jgi:hypothetical protein